MTVTIGIETHGNGIGAVIDCLEIEVLALDVLVLAVYLEKDSVTAEYPLIFMEESEVIRNVLQGKS